MNLVSSSDFFIQTVSRGSTSQLLCPSIIANPCAPGFTSSSPKMDPSGITMDFSSKRGGHTGTKMSPLTLGVRIVELKKVINYLLNDKKIEEIRSEKGTFYRLKRDTHQPH